MRSGWGGEEVESRGVANNHDQQREWEAVLSAGVRAQQLVPGSIAVGGTAAALHAHHRFSNDTDHLVAGLRDSFDEVREKLEASGEWRTARVQAPVLILGSIGDVQVGFRQPRRASPVETAIMPTPAGSLVVPTLDELIGMKAYLAYSRNALRDYLDFAALASCAADDVVLTSLLRSDERYGALQSASVGLEIAKRLSDPAPYDLGKVDLAEYKGVSAEWRDWARIVSSSRRFGAALARALVVE